MANYRDYSRQNFEFKGQATWEMANLGCLQRIADACEVMAKSNAEITADRDLYKRWYYEKVSIIAQRDRTILRLEREMRKLKKGKP